jgi:hypothetical protein
MTKAKAAVTPPRVKRPPKTLKEKKFVKAYMKTGNATMSAMEAYDTDNYNTAASIGSENLKKLAMDEEFRKAGLSNEVIAQNTTKIALTAKKRDQYSGEMYEDNMARLNAMKFAADLMGLVRHEAAPTVNNNLVFQVTRDA